MREAANVLDPDAVTLGFVRRFTGYKRSNLLLVNLARRPPAERPSAASSSGPRRRGASGRQRGKEDDPRLDRDRAAPRIPPAHRLSQVRSSVPAMITTGMDSYSIDG